MRRAEEGRSRGGSEPSRGDPISVQTRFERFPTSIRGAFVFRGVDGNPHAVRVVAARLARIPGGPAKEIPVEDRLVDVAPARDLFVPFEVPVVELEPGWYAVQSTVQVDGGRADEFSGRPFTMPWPRGDVRRGTIVVGEAVAAGSRRFVVERVDLTGDCAVVSWRLEGAGDPRGMGDAVVLADGHPLEALPPEAGGRAAAGTAEVARSVTYPMPRDCHSLEVLLVNASGQRSKPLPLRLP